MLRPLLILMTLSASALALSAPIPKQLKAKVSDLDRLQGLWQEVDN